MVYKIENLTKTRVMIGVSGGGWAPALPAPWDGWRGLRDRIVGAWAVLNGKAVAVSWPQHR